MSDCEKCSDVKKIIRIKSSQDLKDIIDITRMLVNDGVLIVPDNNCNKNHASSYTPFNNLPNEGPWDDYLKYIFKCIYCGQLFSLSVETFHGVGGMWEPIENTTS
jgi:hypothetical protein